MANVSEKHMEAARKLLAVVEAMPSSGNAHFIAAALANAEREGMKRAAEIAKSSFERHRDQCDPSCKCGDGLHISICILSEAGEP